MIFRDLIQPEEFYDGCLALFNDSTTPHYIKVSYMIDGNPVYTNGYAHCDYVGIYIPKPFKPLIRDVLFYKWLISNRLMRIYPAYLPKLRPNFE
jgi:hypothetical protein